MYNAVKRNFTHETFAARHTLLEQVPAMKHLSSHHKAMLVDAMAVVSRGFSGLAILARLDPVKEFQE